MKAVRIHRRGGPAELVYEDAPDPTPGRGDARVRVHACAITPTELTWSATYTTRDGVERLPTIPGHELSGVVESVAPNVKEPKVGDAVYALADFWRDGAAAELVVVRAGDLAPKPSGSSHVQAAAVPLSALTAWQALVDHARLTRGQRVLIHGAAGGVGTSAVQLAHRLGAHVIGTGRADTVALLRKLGADEVIDYTAVHFEDRVRDLDVVLDTVGGDTLGRSWRVLRRGGVLVTIAGSAPADEAARYGVRGVEFIVEPNRQQLVEIARLIDAGALRPIVEATFPLQEARAAFERGLQGHNRGKLVLQVAEEKAAVGDDERRPAKRAEQRTAPMHAEPMRIAVVGVGAVGGYFGGRLARAGEDVVFVARGRTLQALREQGLRIEDVGGDVVVRPARATDDPRSVGPVDVVLLAVKGWQVREAVETVRPLLGPDTFVVPLMDGVEAPDQLVAVFGRERVARGLAVMLGSGVAPGHLRNTLSETSITIGELDGRPSERMARLRNAFERAGVAAEVAPDILSARWEKLILVGPWSAVGAVTRAPLGVVRTMPESRQLMEDAMREVLAVARAQGAAVSDDTVKRSLTSLDRAPAAAIGNLQDIIDGRPSELETEVGAIVRLARAVGVEVPRHAVLYASLLPQERRARGEIDFPVAGARSPEAA